MSLRLTAWCFYFCLFGAWIATDSPVFHYTTLLYAGMLTVAEFTIFRRKSNGPQT